MAAPVRASTRVSISWKGETAFEDTDTLVLTINEYSLDLRVFTEPETLKDVIDWSTVAKVEELKDAGSTDANPVLRWTHILDSRPPQPADVPVLEDMGRFTSLPNGDVEEHGVMFNPKTQLNEEYIETWRRFPSPTGQPYLVLESHSPKGHFFVGRVGSRALGLGVGASGGYVAWRAELAEGKWQVQFKQDSEDVLPLLPVEAAPWVVGEEVTLGGQQWDVRSAGVIVV